jgi:hypothetical protein
MTVQLSFFAIVFLFINVSAMAAVFKEDQNHCVAWKTKKRMFLVSSQEPVGVSCTPTVELQLGDHNKLILWVEIKTSSFQSGEEERDQEVVKLLGEKVVLKSDERTESEWRDFLKKKAGTLNMNLEINNKSYSLPASFEIKFPSEIEEGKSIQVKGKVVTQFSKINIEPPSVGGGLVASVKDFLELHYQFSLNKIEGFDQLTLQMGD